MGKATLRENSILLIFRGKKLCSRHAISSFNIGESLETYKWWDFGFNPSLWLLIKNDINVYKFRN